jgi:hypothetical protein
MASRADVDGRRVTICPACGYPSAGLCAACIEIFPSVAVDPAINPAINTVAGVSHFNPAA